MVDPSLHQVEPLTVDQIAQFKRDGFLVLRGVLDPELCRRACDEMWETIDSHLPRMQRDDPSTWGHITEEESAKLKRPEGGGDPSCHRLTQGRGATRGNPRRRR